MVKAAIHIRHLLEIFHVNYAPPLDLEGMTLFAKLVISVRENLLEGIPFLVVKVLNDR